MATYLGIKEGRPVFVCEVDDATAADIMAQGIELVPVAPGSTLDDYQLIESDPSLPGA